ncbi:MAG: hypothetical protein IT204_25205 [Fimbriimonadaceae bacterium]|nr:hypothetical protein [Fimbriimonadaceae bacterium]
MDWPTPLLAALAAEVRPDQPLPLQIGVANPTAQPLVDASAELTLEIERGVLLSWRLSLAPVPAGETLAAAVVASQPALRLPLNAGGGVGQFTVRLYAADGAWLNEASLRLPVCSAP